MFLVTKGSDVCNYLESEGYYCIYSSRLISNFWPSKKGIKPFLWQVREYLQNKAYLRNMNDILPQIVAFNPDIIHTNSSNCSIGYFIAKKISKPHVWHIREYGDLDAGRRHFPTKSLLEKKMKSGVNTNIAITRDIKQHFHLGDNTTAIYDGPITIATPPEITVPKKNYFLFVGRVTPVKGVDIAIAAFADFCKQNHDYELYIAGDGEKSYVDELHQLAKKAGVSQQVKFLGYRNDVNELMREAKALIVPSRFEAFGFITAEAMLNGCPVIGKNTAGTKEQFDNVDGHICRAFCKRFTTPEELTRQMLNEVKQPSAIEDLRSAQTYVMKTYSAETSALEVLNVYKNILLHV